MSKPEYALNPFSCVVQLQERWGNPRTGTSKCQGKRTTFLVMPQNVWKIPAVRGKVVEANGFLRRCMFSSVQEVGFTKCLLQCLRL